MKASIAPPSPIAGATRKISPDRMTTSAEDLLSAGAIYFGSSLGRVEDAAKAIAANLHIPTLVDLYDSPLAGAESYRFVILAMSTWYDGILQDDWREHEAELAQLDWSHSTVALVCLGDQYGYPHTFADALGIVAEAIEPKGATLIGQWDPKADPVGYEFRASRALRDDRFLGLVLDEDNQSDATDRRIELWCDQIRRELSERP